MDFEWIYMNLCVKNTKTQIRKKIFGFVNTN